MIFNGLKSILFVWMQFSIENISKVKHIFKHICINNIVVYWFDFNGGGGPRPKIKKKRFRDSSSPNFVRIFWPQTLKCPVGGHSHFLSKTRP